MNGLLDSYYSTSTLGPVGGSGGGGVTGAASTVGANLGFNVGSEVLRVQVSVVGILLAAGVVLLLLHKSGNRFSTHV